VDNWLKNRQPAVARIKNRNHGSTLSFWTYSGKLVIFYPMERRFLIILLSVGFVTGLLLTWQFKTNIPIEGGFPSDELTAKTDLLKGYLDEQAYLKSRIVSLRKEMGTAQDAIKTQSEKSNLSILEDLKSNIGLTEITGKGIEILLDDSPTATREGIEMSDATLIQASDLRDIVNILNAANAEAISINNQRILANSPISSVGLTILVNNSHTAPPFVISAVGDSEIMLQRLLNKTLLSGLYERVKNTKVVFELYKKNSLTVPMYNGDLKVDNINLVEE